MEIKKMKNIAVVLVGSGHMDGTEITEAISTLLALSKFKAFVQCFSLNQDQSDVVNHFTKTAQNEKRNLLIEAARISRGNIKDLSELKVSDFDALIFPGGLGVAKNLFDYAYKGCQADIDTLVKNKILDFNKNKKYIGAICISPMLIARAFMDTNINPKITLGKTDESALDAEKFGAIHYKKDVTEICIDEENKIVSTPAFMQDGSSLYEVYIGIEKLVEFIVEKC